MKSWKRIISIASAVALLGAFSVGLASESDMQQTTSYRNISLQLNGNTVVPRDASGVAVEPFIINGTTYLPIRGVASALGMGVNWDGNTHTVKLTGSTSQPSSLTKDDIKALDAYKTADAFAYKVQMYVIDYYAYVSDMNLQLSSGSDFSDALASDHSILVSESNDLSTGIETFGNAYTKDLNSGNADKLGGVASSMADVEKAFNLINEGTTRANSLISNGYTFDDVNTLLNSYASKAYSLCNIAHSNTAAQYSNRYSAVMSQLS